MNDIGEKAVAVTDRVPVTDAGMSSAASAAPAFMSPVTDAFRGNRVILARGTALAVAVVIALAVAALVHLRDLAEARAVTATRNMAQSIVLTIDGMIDSIDIALQAAADDIGRRMAAGRPDPQAVTNSLMAQTLRLPHVAYLRAMDADGLLRYGPGIPSPPADNSGRDYFIRLRDDPRADLLVRKPVVGHIAQERLWSFARRISRLDGSFGGVVIAAITVSRLETLLAQINLGREGSITLRDPEMGMIARTQFFANDPDPTGSTRLSKPFQAALAADPDQGSFISGATSPDGISRTQYFRRSGKYGFVVSVGMPRDEVLAEWTQEAAAIGLLTATLVGALLVFAWQLNRLWARQERDMAALEGMEADLRELAFQDSLTGLPNRRLLFDRLDQALLASRRNGDHGAVLLLDLDRFKRLNDTHGHDIGDRVLVEFTRRLRQSVRDCDTVARLGGDEFVVLLEGLPDEPTQAARAAGAVADKIRQSLEPAFECAGLTLGLSSSIGIAVFQGDTRDPDTILKEADRAMYQAKKDGFPPL